MDPESRVRAFIIEDLGDGTVEFIERFDPSEADLRLLFESLNGKNLDEVTVETAGARGHVTVGGGPDRFVADHMSREMVEYDAEVATGVAEEFERIKSGHHVREQLRRRVLDRGGAWQILRHFLGHQAMHPDFQWRQRTYENPPAENLAESAARQAKAKGIVPSPTFDADDFWKIIERVRKRAADIEARMDVLTGHLMKLTPEEVLAFDARFTEQLDRACTDDLWGAAYVMQGGCSDDGFWDFRSALISMGREVFERTLGNSDSLARLSEGEVDDLHAEGFQYVAGKVFEEMVGAPPQTRSRSHPENPAGERFDSDDVDAMRRRWPKMFARFWDD